MSQTDDRILAKCQDCGNTTLAYFDDGRLNPISNKPGERCPTCGGGQLSAHPLIDE